MRNAEHDDSAAGQPVPDGVYASAVARRSRRRKQILAGALGVTALVGAGVYLVADRATRDTDTAAGTGAVVQPGPGGTGPGATAGTGAATTGSKAPQPKAGVKRTPSPAVTTPRPKTTAEQIAAVRSAARSAASRVHRPVTQGQVAVAPQDLTTSMVRTGGESITVFSAHQDLTGYGPLGWAADKGKKAGEARCTQRIRTSTNTPATIRPTMLLCWNTSSERSVFTIAVKPSGRPATANSVAIIDRTLATLD
ncbi:hypothetical protein [Krasilnikovia sp. MM14-A1004]|uniref:hypothetical protein n=1 Tax=Krasilnikovia sp. MM14-A1004 TaxID=3373541 RepID=UPI00399D25E4